MTWRLISLVLLNIEKKEDGREAKRKGGGGGEMFTRSVGFKEMVRAKNHKL